MEPEGSLRYSQDPDTNFYPEPDEFSQNFQTFCSQDLL
jgi:hypothetical protein